MEVSTSGRRMVLFLLLISVVIFSTLAVDARKIRIDFFYSSGCEECEDAISIIDEIELEYGNETAIYRKDISVDENHHREWMDYGFIDVPALVIENETKIPNYLITKEHVEEIIDSYLHGNKTNESTDNYIGIPLLGRFNVSELSEWSLPLLAVVLGAIDSINPCSFFVLLFLLNLLIYTHSRKRMALIGGIFIFFSGFIYFIFMSALLNIFIITSNVSIITTIAGFLALFLGFLNIKDFFLFKKGLSASIPESKKHTLFEQMRRLVRASGISAVIAGAIVLAISANTYELFCTMGLPMVFTKILTMHSLAPAEYYGYLLLYNIVYVIPLCMIVLLFIITMGRRKLTQWQGQVLKLLSGIMITLLGMLLISHPKLLSNILFAVGIVLISIILTAAVSSIWKIVVKK